MSEALLRRRLVLGPVLAAVAVFGLWAMADELGWDGAFLPAVAAGAVGSFGVAWYLVTSERRMARRPAVHVGAGFVAAATGFALLFIRSGPPAVLYGVLVLGLAMPLGLALSAGYELRRGTYAEAAEATGPAAEPEERR